jgi:hypothetical protein
MAAASAFLCAVIGLFIDDGWLVATVAAAIVVAMTLAHALPAWPLVAGAVLLFGCLGALLVSVMRTAHSRY